LTCRQRATISSTGSGPGAPSRWLISF
jgi:hypothetical protein